MDITAIARDLLPKAWHRPLRRWIYSRIPIEKRMGNEYWQLKVFLNEAQWWERERIETWQLHKLKEIVRYAYQNTPGYYALYQDAGIKPDDIVSLADIQLLPFTTKELLRDNLTDFTSRTIPQRKRIYSTTGGSTGIPFGFYHTRMNAWMEHAFMHSGWERTAWHLGDSSAVLRGSLIGSEDRFWDYEPSTRELHLSSYYLSERTYSSYMGKLEEFRPKHLQAYPSAVTMLANLIIDNDDVGRVNFEVILLGSENIYSWQKDKLQSAFPNSRLFGWYGHCEQVMLAPWCESTTNYHAWPFYGLNEIVNDMTEVDQGEVGEVVGTSFWSYATPFIRYRTMDLARKGHWGCAVCGRQCLTIEAIDGRLQEIIVTATGRRISMTAINMHSDIFDRVKQFQFYQDTPGKVIFRIHPKDSYTENDTTRINLELMRKLGADMHLEIELVKEIPRTRRGKLRFLEQKLEIRYKE